MRGVEHTVLQHVIELEVRRDARLIEIVACLAHLLRIERPVPGLQGEGGRAAHPRLRVDQLLDVGGFRARARQRRRGHLADHVAHRGRAAGRLVLELISGVVRIAQQRGTLGAQLDQLRDHRGVVGRPTRCPADRRPVDALAQRAVRELRQQRLVGGVLQRDEPLASEPACRRRLRRGADLPLRQAVEVLEVLDRHCAIGGGLEHVVLEARREGGDLGVERAQARLLGRRQARAGAHELGVIAREQLQGLRLEVQAGALFVQRLDARPQGRIEMNRVLLRGELRSHLGVDLLHPRVGVAGIEPSEGRVDALQQLPGALQSDDGVVEGGGLRVVGDAGHLRELLAHAGLEGGQVVAVADAVEGWQLERQCARLHERVVGHCGSPCSLWSVSIAASEGQGREAGGEDAQGCESHGEPLGLSRGPSWLGRGQGAMVSFAPSRCAPVWPGAVCGAAWCLRTYAGPDMSIAQDQVVSIHYTLKDDAGEIIDSSPEGEPLAYLHGHGNLIPGLERELTGKRAGDKLQVTVAPADGYGEYDQALVQRVPRRTLKGLASLKVGMRLQAQTGHGARAVTVTRIAGDLVTLDGNHPLAGKNLHFQVEVTGVRAATTAELSHGHVHSPGGHHQ